MSLLRVCASSNMATESTIKRKSHECSRHSFLGTAKSISLLSFLFFSSPLPSLLCSISPPLYFTFYIPSSPSLPPSLQYLHCSPLSFSLFHILIRSHITASTIVTRHQLKPGTNQCIVIQCLQKQRRHSSDFLSHISHTSLSHTALCTHSRILCLG